MEGSAELRGSRESTTLATTGLGFPSPEDAEAPCQAWETTGGHFMSHTERSARAVSRYLASSPIPTRPAAAAISRFRGSFGSVARRR